MIRTRRYRFTSALCIALSFTVAGAGLPGLANAQSANYDLRFDLRTGADPFTFPPDHLVDIGFKVYNKKTMRVERPKSCQTWGVPVNSSLAEGRAMPGCDSNGSGIGGCRFFSGSNDGTTRIMARCVMDNGEVVERSQLVSTRQGVTPPRDSIAIDPAGIQLTSQPGNVAASPTAPGVSAAAITLGVLGVTAGALAIGAAAGGGGGSGGGCPNGTHQCGGSDKCCPSGTSVYCANSNSCVSQTLQNFGNLCNGGQALGC